MGMTGEELKAALNIKRRLNRLREQLADLEATGGVSCAAPSAPVMGGAAVSPGQIAAELTDEIAELQKQLTVEREIIRRALAKAALDDVERKVMEKRYVECWGWRDIGKLLAYCRSTLMEKHAAAFAKITDIAGH
jgi:DNA-directed RNA polymerase specialized sigma24 family protein